MNLKPVLLGVPLVFEDYYSFDTEQVIDKAISVSKTVDFKKFDDFLELGNAGTTASRQDIGPHRWIELRDFCGWSLHQSSKILKSWGYDFDYLTITGSWINCHGRGGWTNFHTHQNCHLSLAAYISAPPGSGDLLMVDPLENHWMGYPTNMNLQIIEGQPIAVESNKVIFFAPFVRHGTQKNNIEQDRWVISMNISAFKNHPYGN